MPKQLNQETIRRMITGGSGGSGGGSFDPSSMAGMASQAWVEQNYLSKTFFSQLFKAFKPGASTSDPDEEVVPNTIDEHITNIKAMFGLWTEQYLSALGQNSGGGGGGTVLTEPLASINSAGLGTPSQANVGIIWNGTAWVYGSTGGGGGGGTVTSITAGTGLAGGTITTSGTIALSTETQTNIGYGVTAYGWGNHANAGYLTSVSFSDLTSHPTTLSGYGITDAYTKTEADAKYMTIAAFENLFNALNSSGNKVSHPYSSGVASIKALVGLWTEQYLSALGQNSGGGGSVTLNEPLASINSAGLGMPTASGQVITWNGSQWIYSIPGGGGGGGTGTVTSITAGTGLSGGTITTMGTISLSTETQTNIGYGVTAYGWGNHANAGYLTSVSFSDLTSHPTTLSGYGITDAKIQNGTITLGSNSITPLTSFTETDPTVPAWAKASTKPSYSFSELSGTVAYNQLPTLYWANVAIANASDNNTSPQFGSVRLRPGTANYGGYLYFGDGTYAYICEPSDDNLQYKVGSSKTHTFTVGSTDRMSIGSTGVTINGSMSLSGFINGATNIELSPSSNSAGNGGYIDFHYNQSSSDYTARIIEDASGRIFIDASAGLRIGDCVITWDSTNNALKIQKVNGNAANFYATGGVTALYTS